MRFAAGLFVVLAASGAVRAGIYNSIEVDEIRLSTNVFKFRDTLNDVRGIGFDAVEKNTLIRKRYLLCEALGGARPSGNLTLEQKLDYSAVLIRRKKFQQAIDFLTPIVRQHPDLFLFKSHLAMAYWGSGQPGYDRRAMETLNEALSKRSWPESFADLTKEQRVLVDAMGWNEGPYDFYRKAETYLLKLMRLRLAEPAGKAYEAVDAIFDDGQKLPQAVRFVNEQGKFEPGRLAAAERRKLPKNALEIVEQLTLWLPEDTRLYWLLGELANVQWAPEQLAVDLDVPKEQRDGAIEKHDLATENIKAAKKIFDELVYDYKVRVAEVRERRNDLQAFPVPEALQIDAFNNQDDDAPAKDTPAPMNPRFIATTFAAGLAVGIFAVWQFQEIRRRRRGGSVEGHS